MRASATLRESVALQALQALIVRSKRARHECVGASDFQRQLRRVSQVLALGGQAARVADHAHRRLASTRQRVLVAAVQVAVQPQVGAGNEVVVGVAEAGRAGLPAVAWISFSGKW